jgi:restriction system protein
MITNHEPTDWHALQSDVAQILRECGFSTEVEKKVRAARGKVKLDVYAEEMVRGRRYSIACECKYWRRAVPQNVVHAFRTVVSEIGANIGYVIARSGFQSGAVSASELTNVKLVTWQEFQADFAESWFRSHFFAEIHKLSPLMTFAEGLVPSAWLESLTCAQQQSYQYLLKKHAALGWLVQSLGPYTRKLRKEPMPKLPLRDDMAPDEAESIPPEILDATAYRELLNSCVVHSQRALSEIASWRSQFAGR